MQSILAVGLSALALVAATPDPLITPAPELAPRQNNPSLVGYVSTSGASQLSLSRECDYPATLSTSGSYAQCCAPSGACPFFSSCSNGILLAESTTVSCDNGYCNTGVVIPTAGASGGESFLGCWPTEYGQSPFSLVRDPGSALVTPSEDSSAPQSSGGSSRASSRQPSSGSESAAPSSTTAPGSAVRVGSDSMAGGILGMLAMLFAVL